MGSFAPDLSYLCRCWNGVPPAGFGARFPTSTEGWPLITVLRETTRLSLAALERISHLLAFVLALQCKRRFTSYHTPAIFHALSATSVNTGIMNKSQKMLTPCSLEPPLSHDHALTHLSPDQEPVFRLLYLAPSSFYLPSVPSILASATR